MKFLSKRIACLLLAAVMAVGVLPASALRAQEELPVTPVGEEIAPAAMAEQPAEPLDADEPAQLAAADELTIPGYTRVTSMPTGGLSGKYLIVTSYGGNYYMLYPGATGAAATANNSARLELDGNGAATGYKVGHGTSYDSATVSTDFSAAENTVSKRGEENGRGWLYSATAVGPNGEVYYLCKKNTESSPGALYQTNCESAFSVHASAKSGYFYVRHQVGNGSYLIFYPNNTSNMNFNQNSSINETAYIGDMMLFQRDPVTIPGYNQVTSMDQVNAVTDKSKFLVVAEGKNGLYALYPRLSNGTSAGALPTPANTYGLRCAKLAVNGQTVTATAASSQSASSLEPPSVISPP